MINITEAHSSNIASIPPPKASLQAKVGSRFFFDPAVSSNGRAKQGAKQRNARAALLIAWKVPSKPATHLAKALENQWDCYRRQLKECQKEFSETSVHQLRVATRRLMTYYTLVSAVVSNDKITKARRKLKRQLKILGKLRDAQVQRNFIEQQMTQFPFLVLVRDSLRGREHHLVKGIADEVCHFKNRKLEHWTSELFEELRGWPEQTEKGNLFATALFRAVTNAFRQTVYCRQAIDPADVQTLHRTRVAFKKFRYMVEALSPRFTGLNKRHLRRLGTYQRRMGNLQDLEILQEWVGRFLREHPARKESFMPFSRHLHLLQDRALRACLKHADALFEFWDWSFEQRESAPQSRTAA